MRQPAPPSLKASRSKQSKELSPAQVHGRLLVADDDPVFRQLLASALRAAAYEVVEVSNGADLFEVLDRSLTAEAGIGSFDLVLSDVLMPGWTGLEVLANLGHGRSLPPVILITAFADNELCRRAKSAGALTVFRKPLDVDDLCLFVRRFLQLRTN